jgi:dolichol-phosphate mannosyltransferase
VLSTQNFHILIVDDNSPDRTADRVRLLQTEFSGRLFWKIEEKGLGTAYVHGFKWALENKYYFEMDADFSIIQMT